ncbi:MAG: response regulator [Nitrospirae bacterium]|nr:response regulator [Nitrospirota bacterium]MCL5977992.1 response regulator [Nitrospirota bacterium]
MDEKIKILFVDDEENVLAAVKRVFIDTGYIILTATSGREALEILENNDVRVIVSDYRMPEMNGVELLKTIREQRNDIVRIVLSGYADLGAVISAINEGHLYKFISKPWNDEDLKITVANAVEKYSILKRNKELTETLKKKNEELFMLNTKLKDFTKQQSVYFDTKSKTLDTAQRIFNLIPFAVATVDFNNVVMECNAAWTELLSSNIQDPAPKDIIPFIKDVKDKHAASRQIAIGNIAGSLWGTIAEFPEQTCIILVFIAGNKL